jgi:2-phospho-L-lactate/phosphoenolpyruvate guanylyltransferase
VPPITTATTTNNVVLVIPVKSFALAKQRLSTVLSGADRAALGRELATRLVTANRSLNPLIVSDSDDVASWADSMEVRFVREPRPGLNQAVSTAHKTLRTDGATTMVVAHSDLAVATSLHWVAEFPGISLVPDRRNEGTNVIALPTEIEFEFAYGPGSFARHYRTARHTGLPVRVVSDRASGADVDSPTDLRLLRSDFANVVRR